jgi:hypothetical protein
MIERDPARNDGGGMSCDDETSLQESPKKKAAWLQEAKRRIPVGTRVRVATSDVDEYVGARGEVVDYDTGCYGDYPLVGVKFDEPIEHEGSLVERDGFYCDGYADDEIVKEES